MLTLHRTDLCAVLWSHLLSLLTSALLCSALLSSPLLSSPQMSAMSAALDGVGADVFEALDTDGDGLVSKQDFVG